MTVRLPALVLPAILAVLAAAPLGAQQVADSAYSPAIERTAWPHGAGPVVAIDAGHHNFHTVDGRFLPFARLLRSDGWRVRGRTGELTRASLDSADVLVIANALAARNAEDWSLPTPSAFTAAEIDALLAWIEDGGRLLLIADHMPFPGAAADLARRLGFDMRNGFAGRAGDPPADFTFRSADGSLRADALTDGDGYAPALDSVRSFTGQAFRATAADARPILVLPADAISFEPSVAWQFDDATPTTPVGGWLQGAARTIGRGRVVVFGEAAMFTAQLAGPERVRIGMNHPAAAQNHRLALEAMRWLGGWTSRPDSLDDVVPNDNREAAGTLRDGVLTLDLVAQSAMWRPDAGPGERVYVFAEEGRAPRIPGPLVRVPAGTTIIARVRNALPDTLRLHGFATRPAGRADAIRIAPRERRELRFEAGAPGTYYYWGATGDSTIATRYGAETQLSGALVIDADADSPHDRVFVITSWSDSIHADEPGPPVPRDMVTINGLSWPHTERFRFTAGDTVHWRVVNVDTRPHPMHLHGFYFDVLSHGVMARDSAFAPERTPRAVTNTLRPGDTMRMRFVAERPGRWLFHCHIAFHVSHFLSFSKVPDLANPLTGDGMDHSVHGMAGLVVAFEVEPRPGAPLPRMPVDGRRVRLHVNGAYIAIADSTYGRLGYVEEAGAPVAHDSIPRAPRPLVLQRDEPVLITIVNHLPAPTAVHWHGIEVEDSYADGVPGFGGTPSSVTPLIAPGDSFTAAFTPPRSGTFMFHSHANEAVQIDLGLAAPLLVVDDRASFDPAAEAMLFIGGNGAVSEGPWINNAPTPAPIELAPDRPTRLRIVSMNPDALAIVTLMAGDDTLAWRPVAKDGADLPPALAVVEPATRLIGVGEALDVEVGPVPAGARFVIRPRRPLWRVEVPVRNRAAD